MQFPEPSPEHRWLHRLVGEWTITSESVIELDKPPETSTGHEVVRLLGEFWTIGEGSWQMPGSCSHGSVMTLGYDVAAKRFVGSFIASVMTHFWPYVGQLDATGNVLTLDSAGPSFSGDGTSAKYQDIIEFVSDDHRTLTARVQLQDGSWRQFMTSHYRRKS